MFNKLIITKLIIFNPFISYLVLFLFSILEATPFIGLFVPGQSILMFFGFLAKIESINLFYIIFFSSLGAITGDIISYFFGRNYSDFFLSKFMNLKYFKNYDFDNIKLNLHNHLGKTIIFGRFNSLTRSFSAFLVGSSKTPILKSILFFILGGIVWSVSFSLLGFIFGESYKYISKVFGNLILFFIIIFILVLYLFKKYQNKKH